jgi:hypothetical protein
MNRHEEAFWAFIGEVRALLLEHDVASIDELPPTSVEQIRRRAVERGYLIDAASTEAIAITWDHRDQVPIDELTAASRRGFSYFWDVPDTGGDQYAIVASKTDIEDDEHAQLLWDEIVREEES